MDNNFPHAYQCNELTELPGSPSLPHYYYPGASTIGGRDGILVEVHPVHGQPWMGTFAFAPIASKGPSGVFTTPDPQRLCVVAKGQGYIVCAHSPTSWELIQASPIIDVRAIPVRELIVFSDFTELVAYGPQGMKWKTKRLSCDGLTITEVTDTFIKGEFWDIRSEAMASFVVDLATGTHEGGRFR